MQSESTEFMTVSEVASYLRIPLSTVYKLVQDNTIPGFRVGKHWRFRRESIANWVKQKEMEQQTLNSTHPREITGNYRNGN